jgi:hypothetical protein
MHLRIDREDIRTSYYTVPRSSDLVSINQGLWGKLSEESGNDTQKAGNGEGQDDGKQKET